MNKQLNSLLQQFGVPEGDYYIDDKGVIRENGLLSSISTGIYIDDKGFFRKESGMLSQDEYLGYKVNNNGDIVEEGIFFDDKTGYYKEDNKVEKEGFWGRKNEEYEPVQRSNSSMAASDDFSWVVFVVKYGFLAFILAIVLMFLALAAPLVMLIWYLAIKRSNMWIAIGGILLTIYFLYDYSVGGFITGQIDVVGQDINMKRIFLGAYSLILCTFIGFYFDKISQQRIPLTGGNHFYKSKEQNERRKIIGLGSITLLIILVLITWFSVSANNSFDNNQGVDYYANAENTSVSENNTKAKDQFQLNCQDNIRFFIDAEDSRDLDLILQFYSTNLIRYWHLDYPSTDQLKKMYRASWKKSSYSSNNILKINSIDYYTYDMYNEFTRTSRKTGKTVTINSQVRFKFDENARVVEVYGIN